MDGHESPLKAWVRKHSPIKSRSNNNKPLPPAPPQEQQDPQDSSPSRRVPISTISGNANAGSSANTQQKSKKRISSLLKHKSSGAAASSVGQSRPTTPAAHLTTARSQSAAGYHEQIARASRPSIQRSMSHDNKTPPKAAQPRPSRMTSHSPTLRTLTDRVSSLESQLRAARAEIATMSQPEVRMSPNPRRALSVEGELFERDAQERLARLQSQGRYEGLVESLLEPTYAAASASASRSRTSASVDRDTAFAAYRAAESAYDDDKEADRPGIGQPQENNPQEKRELARRRSEIRAASWKQVREHMATAGGGQQEALESLSKKRSRSHDISRSQLVIDETIRDQPPARRRKHSHENESPRKQPHERSRSTSSEHGQLQGEGNVRALAPPRQQYYTDEQARTHAVQSQSLSPRRGHARKPSQSSIAKPPSTINIVNQTERSSTSDGPQTGFSSRKEGNDRDEKFMIDLDDAADETRNHSEGGSREGPPSPWRRHVPSPSRLHTVNEEFEWNDEEIF